MSCELFDYVLHLLNWYWFHFRALLKNIRSRKFRDEHKLFAVEGFRIIKEALDAGLTPEAIFFTQFPLLLKLKSRSSSLGLEELNALNDLPLYKIPYKTLQAWSSLTTCPGILGKRLCTVDICLICWYNLHVCESYLDFLLNLKFITLNESLHYNK